MEDMPGVPPPVPVDGEWEHLSPDELHALMDHDDGYVEPFDHDEQRRLAALSLAVQYLGPKQQVWSGQDIAELAKDFLSYVEGSDAAT